MNNRSKLRCLNNKKLRPKSIGQQSTPECESIKYVQSKGLLNHPIFNSLKQIFTKLQIDTLNPKTPPDSPQTNLVIGPHKSYKLKKCAHYIISDCLPIDFDLHFSCRGTPR